ncbi:hypothetical protein BGZ57DRAFT_945868 [Hyaloscypha finlandica]|nr:hypothetical protein BGZ57DRAFT_945868 [Hyaloscypha finlandica]KAH8748966.1 hypothetical protein F5882DRAFT_84915 [Hyaloscypha sp. PMI_1271]
MTYNGRRGPNVSEYIANLNAIPTAQDLSNQDNFVDDDLALFTNTQFFDFDLGQEVDLQAGGFADGQPAPAADSFDVDVKGLDFASGDFPFNDFNQFPGSFTDPSHTPLQPGQALYASSPAAGSPTSVVAPSGTKRKSDSISTSPSDAQSFEEASRLAAEEDKRRRNTAASARFRVKKKQREQALERSAKEMSDKVAALEGRINQLETENKWLKNLITEKNDSKEDIAALWKKFNAENEQRKGSERKSGVGTKP